MQRRTDPIKTNNKRRIEPALVLTLFLLVTNCTTFKRAETTVVEEALESTPGNVVEQTATERQTRPEQPGVAVDSEKKDVPVDTTINFADARLDWAPTMPPPPPPPPNENEDHGVGVIDTPPEIVGGYSELQKQVVYPETAHKAGVEGKVLLSVRISREGKVIDAKVIKSLGDNGCDQAAIDAVNKVKWRPAYQRDRAIEVTVAVPVIFRLK